MTWYKYDPLDTRVTTRNYGVLGVAHENIVSFGNEYEFKSTYDEARTMTAQSFVL